MGSLSWSVLNDIVSLNAAIWPVTAVQYCLAFDIFIPQSCTRFQTMRYLGNYRFWGMEYEIKNIFFYHIIGIIQTWVYQSIRLKVIWTKENYVGCCAWVPFQLNFWYEVSNSLPIVSVTLEPSVIEPSLISSLYCITFLKKFEHLMYW